MKHYSRNGCQHDYGSGNLEYQDSKFNDRSFKAIKKETRTVEPDEAYTALSPKWCATCSAKTVCHHQGG